MIEIDIPMDLMAVGADGVGQGCATRSHYSIHEGELLVAGRPEAWSWVRAKAVDGRHVTFLLVSEAKAAKERPGLDGLSCNAHLPQSPLDVTGE